MFEEFEIKIFNPYFDEAYKIQVFQIIVVEKCFGDQLEEYSLHYPDVLQIHFEKIFII